MFGDESDEQPELCKSQIDRIGKQLNQIITSEPNLHRISLFVSSIPGIGFVATATLLAEMPEPVTGADIKPQGAALGGLAPLRPRQREEEWQGLHRRRKGLLADSSLLGGDYGPWVERGSGDLRETAEDAGKHSRSSSSRWRESSSSPTR